MLAYKPRDKVFSCFDHTIGNAKLVTIFYEFWESLILLFLGSSSPFFKSTFFFILLHTTLLFTL